MTHDNSLLLPTKNKNFITKKFPRQVNTVTRPYTFIEFDTWMQRARKQYAEGGARARRATSALGGQLGDVQRIMMQNIDDVLQRGAVLSGRMELTLN